MRRVLSFIFVFLSFLSCHKDDELKAHMPYHFWQDYYGISNETYISSMAFDDQGSLWMSCYYDSCSLRKFNSGILTYYNNEKDILLDQAFALIYQDEERTIWQGRGLVVSYNSGIRQNYSPPYRYWSVFNTHSPHKSSKMQIDKEGNLWDANYLSIGYPFNSAPEGLRMFDGTRWTVYNTVNSPLPTNHVAALCFDLQGNLLVSKLPPGGQQGVVLKFDGQNWSTLYKSSIPGYWVGAIAVDNSGTIWMGELSRESIGKEYGGGLLAFNGETLTKHTISNSELSSNSVVDLWLDAKENLWIGTYNGGLVKFDRKNNWQIISSENSPMPWVNSVEHIRSDNQGNIWFSVQFYGLAMITP